MQNGKEFIGLVLNTKMFCFQYVNPRADLQKRSYFKGCDESRCEAIKEVDPIGQGGN